MTVQNKSCQPKITEKINVNVSKITKKRRHAELLDIII